MIYVVAFLLPFSLVWLMLVAFGVWADIAVEQNPGAGVRNGTILGAIIGTSVGLVSLAITTLVILVF